MQALSENPRGPRVAIERFSRDFLRDFIQLLRTSHGEKFINANRVYGEYITDKQHVHMNATKWPSLTEFVKFLGREGICLVKEEEEKGGLCIAWRDTSLQAETRRQERQQAEQRTSMPIDFGEDRIIKKIERRAASEAAVRAEKARARPSMYLPPRDAEKHDDKELLDAGGAHTLGQPDVKFSLKPKMASGSNTSQPRKPNVLKRRFPTAPTGNLEP